MGLWGFYDSLHGRCSDSARVRGKHTRAASSPVARYWGAHAQTVQDKTRSGVFERHKLSPTKFAVPSVPQDNAHREEGHGPTETGFSSWSAM